MKKPPKKKRGRPVTTGKGELIGVRLQHEALSGLDDWRSKQKDKPGRAETIRRIIGQAASNSIPPPGWGADHLSTYMRMANDSRWATFVHKNAKYRHLAAIDQCFLIIFQSEWSNPPSPVLVGLLVRCVSAYRAACELAFAGEIAETYPLLRVCLEYAGYALHMTMNVEHEEIWSDRSTSNAARKKARDAFTASDVRRSIATKNSETGAYYAKLYEQVIDFGAHPNETALYSSLRVRRNPDGGARIEIGMLQGKGVPMDLALKTTAQIGICTLKIFNDVFPERFKQLSIDQAITKLSVGL